MYRKTVDLLANQPLVRHLPFLKHSSYAAEKEFRIIYEGEAQLNKLDIPIDLSCIEEIIFNPWLNRGLIDSISRLIRTLPDCGDIKVSSTKLTDNDHWQKCVEEVALRKVRSEAKQPLDL